MKESGEINDYSVFTYPDEIIVELRGRTAEGEFITITYQFKHAQTDTETVQPRDSIDSSHEETICEILAEAGYELSAS